MKQGGLLGRCYLKGEEGDAINTILAAAGHNLRNILRVLRDFIVWMCFCYFSGSSDASTNIGVTKQFH